MSTTPPLNRTRARVLTVLADVDTDRHPYGINAARINGRLGRYSRLTLLPATVRTLDAMTDAGLVYRYAPLTAGRTATYVASAAGYMALGRYLENEEVSDRA